MLAPPSATATRLWTADGFRDDEWRHAETADDLAGNHRLILPLGAYLGLDADQRRLNRERLGVVLAPGETIDAVLPHLRDIALIALAFPAFNDGRSYSKAELLRRHGYGGALRAVGQILVDQLPHMLRVGFDEFEVGHPVLLARLEKGKVGGIPLHYQPAAKDAAVEGKYSWRRSRGG